MTSNRRPLKSCAKKSPDTKFALVPRESATAIAAGERSIATILPNFASFSVSQPVPQPISSIFRSFRSSVAQPRQDSASLALNLIVYIIEINRSILEIPFVIIFYLLLNGWCRA